MPGISVVFVPTARSVCIISPPYDVKCVKHSFRMISQQRKSSNAPSAHSLLQHRCRERIQTDPSRALDTCRGCQYLIFIPTARSAPITSVCYVKLCREYLVFALTANEECAYHL